MKFFLILTLIGICFAAPAPGKLRTAHPLTAIKDALTKSGGSISGSMWWEYIGMSYAAALNLIPQYARYLKEIVKDDNPPFMVGTAINYQINLAVTKSGAPMGLMYAAIGTKTLTIRQATDMITVLQNIATDFNNKTADKVSQLSAEAQEEFNDALREFDWEMGLHLGTVVGLLDD